MYIIRPCGWRTGRSSGTNLTVRDWTLVRYLDEKKRELWLNRGT
jgi:hypothetical protein